MNTLPQSRHGAQSARTPLGRMAASVVVATLTAALLVIVPRLADAASDYDNVDQRLVETFVDAGVSISQGAYDAETTDAVVLATDANFPDALSASAVAAAVGGPVLFTAPDRLSQASAAEIDRLLEGTGTVYVMGGSEAVSEAVVEQLAPYDVQRISGPTRLETAVAAAGVVGVPADGTVIIARAFGPDGASTPSDRTTGWVDAISCGAYAAANQIPILLTETRALSDATAAALQGAGGGVTNAIICGGTTAVGLQVEQDLQDLGITPRRISGPTRVETAVAAATDLFGFPTAGGHQYTVVNGYGENFGFGLAAAPLGNPILLVGTDEPTDCTDESQPSRETLCYLQQGTDDNPARVLIVGSEAIIRDVVSNAVGAAAGGSPVPTESGTASPTPTPTPGDIDAPRNVKAVDDVNDDGTRATVTWNAVADPGDDLLGYNVYVDGRRQGPANPTVPADTTRFQLTGLTEGTAVEVTVTALTTEEEESEESDPATVTPEDEVPTAVANFKAVEGNAKVTLTWDVGPVDTARYDILRAQAGTGNSCPSGDSGYSQHARITQRDTTTYTDETSVSNGTAYCYRITVTDTGGQTSTPASAGPVTPSTEQGKPQVSIQRPLGDTSPAPGNQNPDTIHYGAPVILEYTVTDSDTAAADLRVTVQLSYEGGAAGTYTDVGQRSQAVNFVKAGEKGPATFAVPPCPVGDRTSTTCIRDMDDDNVRFRITVTDGTPTGFGDANTGDVLLRQTPPPVNNFAVTAGANQNTLKWDAVNAPASVVPRYRISRAEVVVAPDSEAGSEACPTPGSAQYQQLPDKPAQPASPATATVTYTDTGLDGDGNTVGGTQVNDILYCYTVQAERDLATTVAGPARLGAGNPLTGAGVGVGIESPPNGARLGIGTDETIRYRLEIPSGVTVEDVRIFWCRDYRQDPLESQPSCKDVDGGFKEMIPGSDLSGEPPRGNGTNSVTWRVPTSAGQDDDDRGAIEVRVTASGGSGGPPARVTGLVFR